MSKLLKRLLGLLFPGVDDPAADSGDPGAGGAGDPPAGDDDLGAGDPPDDDIEFDFEPATPPASRETPEQRIARLEAELEASRRTPATSHAAPSKSPDQLHFEEEESRLRDPNTTDDERWRIQSNRMMRQSHQMSQNALLQAQDLNDKTAFQSKYGSDPRRERYAERIEQQLAEMRAKGQTAPRETIYYFMLGKDIAEGKLKAKAKPRAPAADVPRGRSPQARSDVPARGARSEHDKRRARLENVQI